MTSFDSDSLNAMVAHTSEQIKKAPQNSDLRVHLFQYLALLGQWDRAASQLDLCYKLNASSMPLTTQYNLAILAEQKREQVFSGNVKPKTPCVDDQAESMMTQMLSALAFDLEKDFVKAASIREQVLEQMDENPCRITYATKNSNSLTEMVSEHEWLMDMDSRIANLCEFMKDGEYYWITYSQIDKITLLPPKGLIDLIWINVAITLKGNEQEIVGILPARYPLIAEKNSEQRDELLKCKRTIWLERGDNYWGEGQKILSTEQDEFGILDIRQIEFL